VGARPVSGVAAPGAEVAYQLGDQRELGLGLLYRKDRFQLESSGPAGGGVGAGPVLPGRLPAARRLRPQSALNSIPGVAWARQPRFSSAAGSVTGSVPSNPIPLPPCPAPGTKIPFL